jgi:hypothetical protein
MDARKNNRTIPIKLMAVWLSLNPIILYGKNVHIIKFLKVSSYVS